MQISFIFLHFECKIMIWVDRGSDLLGWGRGAFLQMLDGGGPLVAQMHEQDVAQLAAGPATQRVQDGLMLAHRLTPALSLAGKIRGVANPANPSGQAGAGAP